MSQNSTEAIWGQLSGELRRFIRRRVPDDHVAEDLLQDTFFHIHRSLASLQDEERLASWVYQIARNAIRYYYRRAATQSFHSLIDSEELADDAVGQFARLRNEASCWLPELIDQLPTAYREALTLSEIQGLPQHDVARQLGISLSGAKSRIQRGRKLLRGVLDQCCTFQLDHAGRVMDCDPRPDRKVCTQCDSSIAEQ